MKLFPRRREIAQLEGRPLKVVGDAAIATPRVGDGRLIPLIIVEVGDRADIKDLIDLHKHFPSGDVDIRWGTPDGFKDRVVLILSFYRPVKTTCMIEFMLPKQGILVDQILTAKVFYLQAGQPGDRFITTPNAPRIFVEVPDTGFQEEWEKILSREVAKDMRGRGLNRQQAKKAAKQAIEEMRSVGRFRMTNQ